MQDQRATRTIRDGRNSPALPIQKFDVGRKVLVAHGLTVLRTVKWPTFKSIYYGLCEVVRASHPRYVLKSEGGRYTFTMVHGRFLEKYFSRPETLQ